MTRQDPRTYRRTPNEPDMETLCYWLSRMEPLIRAEDTGEIIVVICNRCGTEGDALYAGTSCVLGIESGEVKLYGILGRGEKELLVVDTSKPPYAKLVAEPQAPVDKNPVREWPEPQPQRQPEMKFDPGRASSRNTADVKSIDSVLASNEAISPVDPLISRNFFTKTPIRADESLGAVRSTSAIGQKAPSVDPAATDPTPRKDTPSVPSRSPPNIPAVRPPSARSQSKDGRPNERKDKGGSPQNRNNLEPIEIVGIIDLSVRNDDPDSASSMYTNTPWDANPSYLRAEDITNIIKSSTPNGKRPKGAVSDSNAVTDPRSEVEPRSPLSAAALYDMRNQSWSPVSATSSVAACFPEKRPISPKSRNTSRTRHAAQAPALAGVALVNEPPTKAIAIPNGPQSPLAEDPSIRQNGSNRPNGSETKGESPKIGAEALPAGNEDSAFPRPKSTSW